MNQKFHYWKHHMYVTNLTGMLDHYVPFIRMSFGIMIPNSRVSVVSDHKNCDMYSLVCWAMIDHVAVNKFMMIIMYYQRVTLFHHFPPASLKTYFILVEGEIL